MIVPNSYQITLKVAQYLKDGGTHEALMFAMGIKTKKFLLACIKNQDWKKKHVKNLLEAGLISIVPRRKERYKLRDAQYITSQVVAFVEELGSVAKICRLIGVSESTYKNRITIHNWTSQELSLLISKRIVDDSFEN